MARLLSRTEGARLRDAGVTLVEILVVLALIGTVASAVGLGISSISRGLEARDEADLLAARMRRASEELLLTGQAVALVWSEQDYRFLALADGRWAPHPVPILGEVKSLDGAIRFQGEAPRGGFAVDAVALPAGRSPLALLLGPESEGSAQAVEVVWDGATAAVSEAGG